MDAVVTLVRANVVRSHDLCHGVAMIAVTALTGAAMHRRSMPARWRN
ncbi:hypothetical protein LG3211_3387 [Lysobacter gummosus]|nr:hypothetical protein LG3211_3387 [Lysobacter gummosus]